MHTYHNKYVAYIFWPVIPPSFVDHTNLADLDIKALCVSSLVTVIGALTVAGGGGWGTVCSHI